MQTILDKIDAKIFLLAKEVGKLDDDIKKAKTNSDVMERLIMARSNKMEFLKFLLDLNSEV